MERHDTPQALEASALDLRTIADREMKLTERQVVLMERQFRLGAKAMRDRDAGWEAADALAGQLESQREILNKILVNCHSAFAGDSVRGPKPFVDLIESLVRASKPAITESLAAYAAAKAARNPNPEGRT